MCFTTGTFIQQAMNCWWEKKQIDPMVTANKLWDESHGRALGVEAAEMESDAAVDSSNAMSN